ncbi:MAG TPA: peptide-methionine (S)-S-oxide reductase MsrA [Anaerolineales bacterium]|nr:peptide-methionine (S)-S-oxide reductase MsrA [Anaerolineales bacterium]
MESKHEIAILGGGCFWCLEAVYDDLQGVVSVESGYAGGEWPDPSYEQVCTGRSGHAEVVRVTFDPDLISYREILEVFFTIHDPTTLNRQGADVGTQYRSVIFTLDERQVQVARQVLQEIEAAQLWERPLVTQIQDLEAFYMAEDYHQEYFRKNPYAGYCRAVVAPKVAKFRQKYAHRLKG